MASYLQPIFRIVLTLFQASALFSVGVKAQQSIPEALRHNVKLFESTRSGSYVITREREACDSGFCHDTASCVFIKSDTSIGFVLKEKNSTLLYWNDTLYSIFWKVGWFHREPLSRQEVYRQLQPFLYAPLSSNGTAITHPFNDSGCTVSVFDTNLPEHLTCARVRNVHPNEIQFNLDILWYIDSSQVIKGYDFYVTSYGNQTFSNVRLLNWCFSDTVDSNAVWRAMDSVRKRMLQENILERVVDNELPTSLLKQGDSIPNVTARTESGDSVSLFGILGTLNILDFSYASCGPCLQLMPSLDSLQKLFGEQGLKVLALDPYDSIDRISRLKHNLHLNYQFLSVPKSFPKQFGVEAYPTLYFVDRKGKILDVHIGYKRTDSATAAIAKMLLEAKNSDDRD